MVRFHKFEKKIKKYREKVSKTKFKEKLNNLVENIVILSPP